MPNTQTMDARKEITEIVNRETRAFDTQDIDLFLNIVHPDMVWPWPPNANAHDPIEWVLPWGKFNYQRWHEYFEKFFEKYNLVHNSRTIENIVISSEEDGAFAVVDVDTLWESRTGDELHWVGRTCKIYTTVRMKQWKLIAQVGILDYSSFK
ncbi:MAG: hypothetical protein OXK72_02015 [Gammaproteobacteria bacterium]|nr:hypothetical protein [Gammaproteobacteria bacterium]